jgi:hypothetical protein
VQQADVTQITMQLGYQCCQRLIAARLLPGRDGQPVHVQVHVDLATLRGLSGGPGGPGGPGLEAGWGPGPAAGWSPARAAADPGSVYLSCADAEAAACDATLTPVVSGQIDWTALDQLTILFVTAGRVAGGPPGLRPRDPRGQRRRAGTGPPRGADPGGRGRGAGPAH